MAGRTVLNGVNWPDGTVTPLPGMYLGVQDLDTLQFYPLPSGIAPITGENGITVTSGATTKIGLGDITPTSISSGNIAVDGNLNITGDHRIIFGDFSDPNTTARAVFVTNSPGDRTVIAARPGENNKIAGWALEDSSTGTDCSGSVFFINGDNSFSGIQNYIRGSGKQLPFYILTGVNGSANPGFAGLMQDIFGNVSVGGNPTLTPDATARFLYIGNMPGTPVGIPIRPLGNNGPQQGKSPVTVDSVNNKFYFNSNNVWHNTNTPDYEEFTSTAGQTIFNTTIRTVAKAGTKSFLQVFVNGTLQREGATKEYLVTGPTQITFNAGIAVSADVMIYGFA